MQDEVVLWEWHIEVPPHEEQVGNVRWYPDCVLMINKELIVEGSSVQKTDEIGERVARELDDLAPGEYIIQIATEA